MSPLHLLQIVPALAGGSLARTTLDAAHAVIAAGGLATVASAGGLMVPELLRRRGKHLDLPSSRHPLWARLSLPVGFDDIDNIRVTIPDQFNSSKGVIPAEIQSPFASQKVSSPGIGAILPVLPVG